MLKFLSTDNDKSDTRDMKILLRTFMSQQTNKSNANVAKYTKHVNSMGK